MGFSDKKMASSVAMLTPLDQCYRYIINKIYKVEKDCTANLHILNHEKYISILLFESIGVVWMLE